MEEYKNATDISEEFEPKAMSKKKWNDFVNSDLVNFFEQNKIEKLTVDDGNGNKAKLSRTKDNEIKIESSSITII